MIASLDSKAWKEKNFQILKKFYVNYATYAMILKIIKTYIIFEAEKMPTNWDM